jgi:general transcription factor 3C polypeptide 5 (transcription factor C subunit 1)
VIENEVQAVKARRANHVEPVAGVSLRPNDPFVKKLSSTAVSTQNVLIKVTVPKRTGRKRKRGSDGPFEGSLNQESNDRSSITAQELLQRLRDNEGNYDIQLVGIIKDTHRFSGLPDFQVRADDVPIMRELRDHAMQPDYDRLKAFNINFNPDINASALFPGPPSFLRSAGLAGKREEAKPSRSMPKQPTFQSQVARRDGGSRANRYWEQDTSLQVEELPTEPPDDLPKKTDTVKSVVNALKEAFKDRPIVSVRAFHSMQAGHTTHALRSAVPYVGYYMHTGPWARTIAKYGIDPRKDPAMRKYQTIAISNKRMSTANIPAERRVPASKAHIFDGTLIGAVSNLWQLCDLTDPILERVINTESIRSECELEQWGWYHNGTVSKLRALTREKMVRIVNSEAALPEEDYKLLAALPDHIKDVTDHQAGGFDGDKSHLRPVAQQIVRDAVYRVRGTAADEEQSSTLGFSMRASTDGGEFMDSVECQQDSDDEDEDYIGEL